MPASLARNEPDDPTGPVNCARVSAWCSKATIVPEQNGARQHHHARCVVQKRDKSEVEAEAIRLLGRVDLPIARTLGRTNCPAVSASVWPFVVR